MNQNQTPNNFMTKVKNFFSKDKLIVIFFLMLLIPATIMAIRMLSFKQTDIIKHRSLKEPQLIGELDDPDKNLDKFLVPSVEIDAFVGPDETKKIEFSHLVGLDKPLTLKEGVKLFVKATHKFVDANENEIQGCKLEVVITDRFDKPLNSNQSLTTKGFTPLTQNQKLSSRGSLNTIFKLKVFSNDPNLQDGQTTLLSTYEIVDKDGKSLGPGQKIEMKTTLVA